MTELYFGRRFCGPPGVANGGFACGSIAALHGGAAEVTLRRPCRWSARWRRAATAMAPCWSGTATRCSRSRAQLPPSSWPRLRVARRSPRGRRPVTLLH